MPPPRWKSFAVWLARVLALAAAYLVAGKLGLLLAVPPGYASAVWPPAGIALAGILIFGHRHWPGVWLGSFCVNLGMGFDASTTAALLRSLAIAGSIGLGAAMQASAGAFLIWRFAGYPSAWTREREVFRFLVLGGPVSCLVGATWGAGTLWLAGVVPAANLPVNWATWWTGDTIGALIFSLLGLIAFGRPREIWRRRGLTVALPLAACFAVAVAAFFFARTAEEKRLRSAFAAQAGEQAHRMKLHIHGHAAILQSLASFFESSQDVSREEFRSFVHGSLREHSSTQALSWVPLVPIPPGLLFKTAPLRGRICRFRVP